MRRSGWAGHATIVVFAFVALLGCSGDNSNSVEPSSSPPSSPSPSPAEPLSDSEKASIAASSVLRRYFSTVDRARQDTSVPPADLDGVASSAQLAAQENLLRSQRDDGLRQLGETKMVEVQVESISLGMPATALIDVCWDVRDVDVVDSDGNSVVSPERKAVGWTRYTVTNDTWDSAPEDGWRVSGGADLKKAPCIAS